MAEQLIDMSVVRIDGDTQQELFPLPEETHPATA